MLGVEAALIRSVDHYLGQSWHLLELLEREPEADALLAVQLAPDGFSTGFHLAVSIQFAARALCLPAGIAVPETDEHCTLNSLRGLHAAVASSINKVGKLDWTTEVKHQAGKARLQQPAIDYVARFALPNMLFHFTMAYAGLRLSGMKLGKADFDGLHDY